MSKSNTMLNFTIVKDLITKHVEISDLANRLAWAGARIEELEELNLFKIALDVVGFPNGNTTILRCEENLISVEMREMEIDDFVKQLYAECDELMLQKPHLFVKK